MQKTGDPIIVEETYATTPSVVWNAITEIDQMRKWYFQNIPEFKAEVGFRAQFLIESGEREFLHLWKVTEVTPKESLVHNWRYEGYPGDSFVTFEIIEEEGATRLRLTHQVRESFPKDIAEFSRESCSGGWAYFIKMSLKAYLEEKYASGSVAQRLSESSRALKERKE